MSSNVFIITRQINDDWKIDCISVISIINNVRVYNSTQFSTNWIRRVLPISLPQRDQQTNSITVKDY